MAKTFKGVCVGVFTGFLNGFFGSGGGTVAVPAMRRLMGVETRRAHATAVAVILPLSVISAIVYVRGTAVDWGVLATVAVSGALGGLIGSRLLRQTPANVLHKLFGACLLAAAVRMIL